ncbi:MAG: DUF6789 family protein [Bacillota bacterium]
MIWRFFPINLVIKPDRHVKKHNIVNVKLKKRVLIRDKIIPGAIVGISADVLKLLVNLLGHLLGFTPLVFWQLIATRFVAKEDLFKPSAYLIGGLADIIVTSMLGVVFIYFMHYFPKHLWLKGIGFGLLVWVGLFGFLLGPSVKTATQLGPSAIMVTIAAHACFGLALAFFTRMMQNMQRAN